MSPAETFGFWYFGWAMFFFGSALSDDKAANEELERETFRGAATLGAMFLGATWPIWIPGMAFVKGVQWLRS